MGLRPKDNGTSFDVISLTFYDGAVEITLTFYVLIIKIHHNL